MRTPIAPALIALFIALLAAPAAAEDAKDLRIALGGDMIGPFHALPEGDAGFDAVRALFKDADIGLANQEGAIFDLDKFDGFPAPENGGGYPLQPRAIAADIRGMGVSLVSKANNHATDWGAQGLLATFAALKNAGIGWAGAGADPADACAPAARGGVALVSAATTFPPMSLPVARVQRPGMSSVAGPGICAIHVQPVRGVLPDDLNALKAIAGPLALPAGADDHGVRIGDQRFVAAPRRGLDWEMKPEDVTPVISAIGAARSKSGGVRAVLSDIGMASPKARAVVFAIHAHETAGTVDDAPPKDFEPLLLHRAAEAPAANDPTPAAFVPRLAHQAIDAGADVVLRSGPHTLGGIEIYKGKPIFYSLGSLFFDFGGRRAFPAEWYETVVPVVTRHGKRIVEIRLNPATIDPDSGLPSIARGEAARRSLARLDQLSRPYRTQIEIVGDVGVIRPGAFDGSFEGGL